MDRWAQVPPLASRGRQSRTWRSAALWWAMAVPSALIVVYAATYFLSVPGDRHFAIYIRPLRWHIAGGMGALLTGPGQFSERLRARALNFHRWLGRFYLVEVLIGSTGGVAMAFVSSEGLPTHLGFGILAVLWFSTGLQAYRLVRKGNIEAHRQWMIRNFALTFAAVTLRIESPFMLALLHWPFRPSYIIVWWLCWAPNLLVAEWMVRRHRNLLATAAG